MNMLHCFPLVAACAVAQAKAAPFMDRAPVRAAIVQGLPAGGCPLYADGFDENGVGEPLEHVTHGGYVIRIDRHTITVVDTLALNAVEHWGDPHENLNGKHIKDWGGEPEWSGSRRSLVLGDGTKLTLEAEGAQGIVLHTSIYDGDENLQFDNCRNALEHHGIDAGDTALRDADQHDGETATFSTDIDSGVANYTNAYDENASFELVEFEVPLGRTGGYANPNQVTDYYDDPRLGHT
ncbi:MAG: hypothetical protein EOP90_11530 [Lysobacteraceae bacterium]|nr:MAG: hypothetical protein EOP90_11530 [Xanthomonadaceae bacterium]